MFLSCVVYKPHDVKIQAYHAYDIMPAVISYAWYMLKL